MASKGNELVRKAIASYSARRKEYLMLVMVAALVTVSVALGLHQRGIAATHTEQVLDCQYSGGGAHTHDSSCYDASGSLVCPLQEREYHVHDDSCYEETRELACGFEEHQHSDACYDEEGNLVCELAEHTHSDDCYQVTRELTCKKDEVTETHTHGPGCFRTVTVEDDELVAQGADEVTDTVAGEPTDPAAGSEPEVADGSDAAAAKPEQSFSHEFKDQDDNLVLRVDAKVPEGALPEGSVMRAEWVDPATLTKKQRKAVGKALSAKAEGAVLAQQAVDITFLDAEGNKVEPSDKVMVTLTSQILGTDDQATVVHIDDLTKKQLEAQEEALKEGKTAEEAEPKRSAEAIESLTSEELHRRDTSVSGDQIAFDADKFSTYVLSVTSIHRELRCVGEDVTVTVDAPAQAGVPAGATLQVTEISAGTDEHEAYQEAAMESVGAGEEREVKLARFFDIKIMDASGREVQPAEAVQVSIELADAPRDAESADVVHFDSETGEPELVNATEDAGTSTFEAEGFSVYGVVYTVDFHWDIDGKTYEFSLPGGGFVSLDSLVEALGIAGDASGGNDVAYDDAAASQLYLSEAVPSELTKKFVADVDSVAFSNPNLAWVGAVGEDATVGELKTAYGLDCEYSAELTEEQIGEINAQVVEAGDWALISLRPFTSEETLVVTMKNGEVFTILVTDAQISTHVISADGQDYIVTVTYDDAAQIPEDAKLNVTEITATDEQYNDYLQKTMGSAEETDTTGMTDDGDADEGSAPDEIPEGTSAAWSVKPVSGTADPAYARFFDIEIQSGGQKVEPNSDVSVQISLANVPEVAQSDLQVVHFAKDGMELMDVEKNTRETGDASLTELSFVTDEFSVFSIKSTASGTVDDILNKDFVLVCHNVAVSPEQNTTFNYTQNLRGIPVTINGDTISTDEDSLPVWRITRYWSPEAGQYYYQMSTVVDGETKYLHIADSNRGTTYVDSTPQDLRVVINDNHTRYRFYHTNTNHSLDLFDNDSTHGFGTYNGDPDHEFFTLYELGEEIRPHVTVHFVDRDGTPLEDVQYAGSNSSFVTKNADGTFEIPYNWKGTSGTVNLETDFSFDGYTYANAHLAKISTDSHWTGSNYNWNGWNGLVIDSTFTSNGSQLRYKSYAGSDSYKDGQGNGVPLETYRFDEAISTWTYPYARDDRNNPTKVEYAAAGDKDVYVILDPKPASGSSGSGSGSGSGGEGGGGQSSENDPNFKKKLEPNGDGTYTLSLSVTGHAQNNTDYPKANVLLVVDTSSSMTKAGYTSGKKRIEETKAQIKSFTDSLFALNGNGQEGQAPTDTVEVAMFSFDGSTHDLDLPNQWMTTGSQFNTALGQLYTHKGTNWEDALQKAYTIAKDKKNLDHDPTFVVFFTDGEPSQYTNFHQSEASNSPSNENGWKYYHPYLSRETANDEARQIVLEGLRFYSMFAYGDGASYNGEQCTQLLHNLVKYGYDTTSDLSDKNFFNPTNASDMTKAFTKILHSISSTLGITDVKMNDSITSLTRVGISNSGGEAKGFKYTQSGGRYGAGQTWADAPLATYDNNGVQWDLSKDKNDNALILEDGVTYTVSFTVWPKQEAYDYVTQLNDGFIELDDIEEPDKSCFKYNEATGKYEVVTNPTSGPDGSGNVVNETSYTKTESETVTELPDGVPVGDEIIDDSGANDWPSVITKTTYTLNTDGTTWTKTVVTEVIDAFNPPDKNMTLTNSLFNVEKQWQLGNRPEEMVKFLYDTTTGKVIDAHKNINFVINQVDNPNDSKSFAQVQLGYDESLHDFNWADATSPVPVEGITYYVGTRWVKGLDISVGLMLSPAYAVERNIFLEDQRYIPVYSSLEEASSNEDNILYYVLETGHDYLIDEPALDYRFDFETEVYHPMLVDGQPQNVKVEYKTVGGKTVGIMSETGEALSVMQGRNILRGELDMKKTVLDPVGNEEPDNTEVFDFIVTLENNTDPGPFYNGTRQKVDDQGNPVVDDGGNPVMEPIPDEQNIPWYGVHRNGKPADEIYYYHLDEPLENGDIVYVDEKTACVGGNYLNGLREGYSGNQMIPDTDRPLNKVSAEIKINAQETWTITNVPGGTTYTIEEIPTEGYAFVDATEAGNTTNKVTSPAAPVIRGNVHSSGGKTEVEFRNQRQLIIDIYKVDVEDLNKDQPNLLPGAAFRLEKYRNNTYQGGLDTTWGTGGQKTATEKEDNPGKFRFIGIAPGYYKLVETAYPDGYVNAEGDPIFKVERNAETNRYEIKLLNINTNGEVVPVENNQSNTVKIDDTDKNIQLLRYGNTPGAALPNSGGLGTAPIYLLGIMLTGIASAGFALRLRKKAA